MVDYFRSENNLMLIEHLSIKKGMKAIIKEGEDINY
jgi:hypothetical protein